MITVVTARGDRDLEMPAEPTLFEHNDRLTRSDLWAWRDAVDRTTRPLAPPNHDSAGNSDFESVVAAMGDPEFYPDAPDTVEVRETDISWVFLAGDRAYKLKKPVVLPFLDYGSVARRREMCEREIELNQRLAGELYLGLRAIVRRDGRLQLAPAGPDAIEHVVEMRRFDETATLAALVAAGRATPEMLAAVGRRLAAFHANADSYPVGGEVLSRATQIANANFESLLTNGAIDSGRVFAARRFADAFMAGHAAILDARAAGGHVREGHGDLRAEHVLIGETVQVFDCAEFDAALRTVDVGADLAFLVMDLARLGRPDLARTLVDAHRHAGGDPGPDELIAFHAANRAWVRAKVAALRGSAPGTPPTRQTDALDEASELFALGERLAWQARLPLTLIVCGPPASGKSELARELSEVSGLPVVSSDKTRKRLAGLQATQRAPQDAYSVSATERTYADLGAQAAGQIGVSGGVIVDATFARRADRQAFSAACVGLPAPLVFECRAPAQVIQMRAHGREADPRRASDAGPQIAARLRGQFEALADDVAAARHFALRTDQPAARVVEDVIAMLDRRLAEPATAGPPDGTRRWL
jgi:uncharacterized protein